MADKSGSQRRMINLFCPSLSKAATVVAWDDQRLDLGAIARTFGLEAATLRLNGHFIGRGLDLVASSVTWKSLLSFFSARGLSTGAAASSALLVHGNLSKSPANTKRVHDPAIENRQSAPKKMRIGEKSSGNEKQEDASTVLSNRDGLGGMKRKLWREAISPVKRTKTDGSSCSNSFSNSGAPKLNTTCSSYKSEAMKRAREEQVLLVRAASKRTR